MQQQNLLFHYKSAFLIMHVKTLALMPKKDDKLIVSLLNLSSDHFKCDQTQMPWL